MKNMLEKLWNEYLAGECAVIDTEEERELAKKAVDRHKTVNDLLTKAQSDAVESYVDMLCEIHSSFVKKAFFKGCELATSFFVKYN